MKPLHAIIKQQVEDYTSKKVTITEQYQFSMFETLQQIENFWHSHFMSGQLDSNGNPKPFFNIIKGKTNIAVRATDIDRKDITMKETVSDDYFRAFVASKFNHVLMNKMDMEDYLNTWGEMLPRYGSVVTKVVDKGKDIRLECKDWMTFICDPVSFNAAPKIEKLTLTPDELRQKAQEGGWDEKEIEALITAKQTSRTDLKGSVVYEDAEYITVYETHHKFSNWYLKDKPSDKDRYKYSQQVHIVAWHVGSDGEREDFTLYRGKESKDPYSIAHWQKAIGRTLGVGVVEDMFEPQIWHNYDILKLKQQLDLASTTIFQTTDGNVAARNVLTNMQNGDFIVTAAGGTITPVNVTPQGVEGIENNIALWKTLAEDLTSTPDAIQGQTMPSGTAFRQVAMLNTEAHSYFDYVTECKGNYLENLYRDYLVPFIKRQLAHSDEIVATLSAREIDMFDAAVVNIAVTEEIKTQTLAGTVVSPIQLDQLRQQALQNLKQTGAKRYLNPGSSTWKDYFKDFEWTVDINITGESEDKKTTIDTLFNALQTVAQNPGILQNPTAKLLFLRLLEASDIVSPIEIQEAEAQNPQQPMNGQQPQQPGQPQPDQPQPPQGNYQGGAPQGAPVTQQQYVQ